MAVAVSRLAYGSAACFLNGDLVLKLAPGSPGGTIELNRQSGLNLLVWPSLKPLVMGHVTAPSRRPAAALAPSVDSWLCTWQSQLHVVLLYYCHLSILNCYLSSTTFRTLLQ